MALIWASVSGEPVGAVNSFEPTISLGFVSVSQRDSAFEVVPLTAVSKVARISAGLSISNVCAVEADCVTLSGLLGLEFPSQSTPRPGTVAV